MPYSVKNMEGTHTQSLKVEVCPSTLEPSRLFTHGVFSLTPVVTKLNRISRHQRR